MARTVTLLGGICTTFLMLSGCAPFKTGDHRAAVCNQLNSQIIFSGGTNITRDAEIQNASLPLQERAYDVNCQNS